MSLAIMKMPLLNAGLKWNFCRHKHSWTLKQLTDTLNLPKTTFPQRANYVNVESTHVESISSKLYYNAKVTIMNHGIFTKTFYSLNRWRMKKFLPFMTDLLLQMGIYI